MKILLLGGTGFLGRAIAAEAVAHGHEVTCLARGHSRIAQGVTLVRADRNDDNALTVVADRNWDAVIDLTSQPIHAERAIRDLRAQHWIYVSSSSVYARGDVPEQTESSPTVPALDDGFMTDMTHYGSAKVSCEGFYRRCHPWHTIVRPGLIGGDGDHTGRSGYYPWRFAHPTGPDVLVPDPTFPVALIDVEDLAIWIIVCAEQRPTGTFNAAGNATTLAEVLDVSQEITASTAVPYVVSNEVLSECGVSSWMGPKSLPLWVDVPGFRHVATLNCQAARERGLRLRPLRATLMSALRYEERRQQPRLAGLSDQEEQELRQKLRG